MQPGLVRAGARAECPLTTLRIAVAGAGLIGRRHVDLVHESVACDLAAIVDPAPAARAMASRLGVAWHASIPEALDRERPDGIIVATPSQLHLEHALACLEAGVPTLLEKPVATTVEDGVRVALASAAHGVPLLVGHHRRHSPILAAARRVVDSGVLGRPVALTGSAMFRKPDGYFDEAPWRRRAGGGPLLINMIHEVDTLRYLFGEITSVQAIAASSVRRFEVEDTVAVSLVFASGALGTFLLSDAAASTASWELTSGENAAYPSVADVDCYVLAGDAGSLGIPTMRLSVYKGTPSWWEPLRHAVVEVARSDPLAAQLAHFCAVIRGDADPLVTAWDGAQNVLVVNAIAEAGRTGRIVPAPDVRTRA
jgi:predicted dehydrogenase